MWICILFLLSAFFYKIRNAQLLVIWISRSSVPFSNPDSFSQRHINTKEMFYISLLMSITLYHRLNVTGVHFVVKDTVADAAT